MKVNLVLFVLAALSVLGLSLITTYSDDSELVYEEIEDNLFKILQEQADDLDQFENQLSVYSNPFFIPEEPSAYTKRVFINGGLVYWTSNEYIGDYNRLKSKDSLYLFRNEHGLKIVQRREVVADKDLVEIYSFLDVYDDPQVKNQYLEEQPNPVIFESYPVQVSERGSYQIFYKGKQLFGITLVEESSFWNELLSLSLILILFTSLSLLLLRSQPVSKLKTSARLGILAAVFILGRIAIWYWTKNHLTHWSIFKPINFTAEPVFYSLGDTIMHLVLSLVWFILVYWHFFLDKQLEAPKRPVIRILTGGALVALVLLSSWLSYGAVWMLLENSQILLDIAESIRFDGLRLYAYLYVLMVGINVVLLFSMAVRVYNWLNLQVYWHYGLILGLYLVFGLITQEYGWVYGGAFIAAWLVIDFFGFSRRLRLFRYQTFVYLIILITSYAAVCSFTIYKHTEKDNRVAKEKFGNRLLIKNDILGEHYLNEIIKEIENDRYVRTRLLSRLLSRQNIREKIQRQFLSSYFKKYDVNVYLFNSSGESLQPETSPDSYQQWEDKFRKDSLATDYEKIYFIQDLGDNVRNKYICFLSIDAYGRNVGHIILDLTLKKYIPSSVFPELLVESRFFMSDGNEFDYAVYKKKMRSCISRVDLVLKTSFRRKT